MLRGQNVKRTLSNAVPDVRAKLRAVRIGRLYAMSCAPIDGQNRNKTHTHTDIVREGEREREKERERALIIVRFTFTLFIFVSFGYVWPVLPTRVEKAPYVYGQPIDLAGDLVLQGRNSPRSEMCKIDGTDMDAWCPVLEPCVRLAWSQHRRPQAPRPS